MQNNLYSKESIGLLFAKTNNSPLLKPVITNLQQLILFFLFFLLITNISFAANTISKGFFNKKVDLLIAQIAVTSVKSQQSFSPEIATTASPNIACGTIQIDDLTVSNCINHPLMDVATLDIEVSWINAPLNDSIVIQMANQTEYIAVPNGITSPHTLQFIIPADGSTTNNINANWKNTVGCEISTAYDAPTACSNDEISCDILYICGDDKPYDGDAWDHGWLEYLDAVNGNSGLTPAFSKNEANGIGLYDPNNTNNALAINFNEYDLIIVSATTEGRLSNDIIDSLAITTVSVLNSNINIYNDLGMTASEADVAWQTNAYIDNTTSVDIYNFNNKINPWSSPVLLTGDYHNTADIYLWEGAGDAASGIEGVLFNYTADDVLPSIASHGNRTFLGYHMNGFHANNQNGGAVPTPDSVWFEPAKHLTLVGKIHFDLAINLAAAGCNSTTINACALTNPYPGFPIDFLNDNTGWIDYDLVNDLELIDNGNGTKTISGSINNGTSVDFGSGMNGTSCGLNDGWVMSLTLSDKMDWTTFQAAGGSANVHANCNAQIADLDYWDISGTLTGIGCNTGRTLTINGPKAPYRLQIGYGGNGGDNACDFGMSTWFDMEEDGTALNADIYAFLDESCYNTILPSKDVCYLISDGAGEGSTTPDTFYTFNHTNGAVTPIGPTGTLNIEAMAYDTVNQIIYTADDDDFGTIDITTGVFTAINTNMGSLNGAEGSNNINGLDGMTYDYVNNIIWATERASSNNNDGLPDDLLLKIDPITGMPLANGFGAGIGYLTITTNEHDLDDVAMAADGTLYAISNYGSSGNQRLGIINTTTGAFTEIGDYGVEDVESLTFTATGQLLATTGEDGDHKNRLYSIDAATATATFIGSIEPAHDVEACDCSFGNLSNLQIGDKVWADLNNNGLQDIDEPGLKDVKVNLLAENGSAFLDNANNPMTTTTDIYGLYNFAGLVAGNYIVEFELPTGTSFAIKDAGSDDAKDSDADGITGRTGMITLAGSINNLEADAGILNANVTVRDCTNDGELFVLDEDGAVLLRYNSTTGALIDTFIHGFIQPMEMIIGNDNYLYISDRGFRQIRRYSLITGAFIDVLAENISAPVGMTFGTDGMLYVNNKNNDEVLKIDLTDGTTSVFITDNLGGLDGNYGGLAFGPDGNLYVTSRNTDEVLRFNGITGAFIDAFVTAGSGTLNGPDDLTFGSDGNLYVTSSYSDQVKRYNGTTGAYIDDFITFQSGGLNTPRNVIFGSDGNIYVSGQDAPKGIYRYNESTGNYVDLFATGLDGPRGILFAPVPNCDNCCSQINYANNSLENGNFSSFTSGSNPNGTATLITFGGSDAIDWNPSGGFGTNGSPITDFGANPGYWVDASTNGGAGSLDGNRFYWLEPRNSAGGSDCLGAVSGADLLGAFCQGDTVEICGYVAAYDPNNINSGTVSTDFVFEIYTNNGNDPADFVTTPTGTSSINDNGGNNESFTLSLPASTTILDITGVPFTGANGQVADWRTLNWQSVCFQLILKEEQNNYSSIVFSMADGSDGMAIDNLSIRDISTPDAGKDTTLYTCAGTIDLPDAQSGETWSKITEPMGATASIDANTGEVTDLTENGTYKFLLAKTIDAACHDTIRVLVNCIGEICNNNIDDDGDGLIDCADPDCQAATITNLTFSNCTLVANTYQSTLSIEVAWSNPPAGENMIVSANNTMQTIDILGGATSPTVVEFTIVADNSQYNPISIDYSGGGGCSFSSTYNTPAPCPVPTDRDTPCDNSSGHVGGIVFEDLNSDGLQDTGEPGLAGILVAATDSTGATVGQTTTNNLGVFQFETLTNGIKVRLEFTAIPSGMYPTNATTYKGTTVQFHEVPSCEAVLGLIDPTENDCAAPNNALLQNGYSLVSTLPAGDAVTLSIKDITQLGTLWQTAGNRNTNQAANVSTIQTWTTADFEGASIFSTAVNPKDGTIYAIASPLHASAVNTETVLFDTTIDPKVFKIDAVTGVVTRIAELSGNLGLGYIDFDAVHEQLFLTNMDDGKIYRLNTDGVILSSFDPLSADNGIIGQLPALGDRVLGVSFNPINKRVYYSVWSNHYDRTNVSTNINGTFNTIRSIALDANGAFIGASDQLEITIPHGASGFNLTTPVGDIAFNRAGDKVLLAELPLGENTSTNQIVTVAYIGVLREYQLAGGTWNIEPTYSSNEEGKYDIGSQIFYKGRNSRGGVDWGYESVTGTTINGDDSYIIATGDALHINAIEGDNIFGLQFMPATGGNIANSILIDLDNNTANENLYAYGDIDVYKDYCANLSLEIGNYVWLDEDEDGVQDPNEFGMEGINVSLYNAAGDSLTTVVTDANGEYYFNDVVNGLMPTTTYYIVIGKGGQFDTNLGVLNQVNNLTTINLGTGNYPDLNDSDGAIATLGNSQPVTIENYPFIEVQTGIVGQNDHSFDFGFRQICSAAFVVNDSLVLCPGTDYEGSVAINDKNYADKNFSVIAQPTNGTVIMNTVGTFNYTSTTSTCENDEFTYQVCDETNICCVSAIVHLNFNDTTIPTLTNIPANDTISCDELIPLPSKIFAVDNCPKIALDVQEESTQGEDGCSLYDYRITRTWTATDECGNSTSASQIIEVEDAVAPDIYRIYTLPNGKKMVAGVMELVGENWKTVNLPIDFSTKPIILHQVVTSDVTVPVVSQIKQVSVSQFQLRIKAEEAYTTKLVRKSIAWIAIEAGGQTKDYQLDVNSLFLTDTPQAVNFQQAFPATPALFVGSQTTNELDPFTVRHNGLTTTGATLSLQEEASNDAELTHTNEKIGYLAIEKLGSLREERGILIGEVGTVAVSSNWKIITLNHTYHNPVIIANSLSNLDGGAATVSVRNVENNQFEISINEWAYLDHNHTNELISYIVVEGSIPLESPNYCEFGTDSLDISIDFKSVDNCDVSVVINYVEKDTFIGATKIITRTWSAEDECGNATAYAQEISCEGVSLQLKSVLQGAMLGNDGDGLMRDDLRRKNLLPMEEPYAAINRFKHVASGGGEVINDETLLADNGANSIVDWVFVELRDANDVDNVIATKSALIQRDGDVVTVQGDSILHFTNTRIGNYYVAIRHRNHLGVISLNTYAFAPNEFPMVDFTFNFTPITGTHSSVEMDDLESLWSGDLNSDGKVIYQGPNNDIFFMFLHVLRAEANQDFLPNYISRTYTNDDFNLDGAVIYQGPNNDRARLLFNTILKHPDNPSKLSNFIIYSGGN